MLDRFLEEQIAFQSSLRAKILTDAAFTPEQSTDAAILDHFRLLQATDNLSLLTCVDYARPAHLLHPLPLRNGGYAEVQARHVGPRHFVLEPYPFERAEIRFEFPAVL